jgi:transcriptional regulator with XRE-family HTH domain
MNTQQRLRILGEAVRAIREARGLLLVDLADSVGINKSYLSKIENQRAQPSPAVLVAIARELAVPVTAITCNLDKLADDMAAVDAAAS